jgi:hypothetical protein
VPKAKLLNYGLSARPNYGVSKKKTELIGSIRQGRPLGGQDNRWSGSPPHAAPSKTWPARRERFFKTHRFKVWHFVQRRVAALPGRARLHLIVMSPRWSGDIDAVKLLLYKIVAWSVSWCIYAEAVDMHLDEKEVSTDRVMWNRSVSRRAGSETISRCRDTPSHTFAAP